VSQLGMLAGTAVYVNAGTQLAQLDSLQGILSPALLGSFVLLGLFPLIARRVVAAVQQRQVYARWADQRPKAFDRNLIVIGGGAGGLVSAYIAAAVKAKVTLIEAHKMGGDCLNYGCVPSKALIKSAKLAHQMRHASRYGLSDTAPAFSFKAVMQRVHDVIKAIEPHDSIERYTGLGVEVLQGYGKLVNPWTVEVALNNGGTQRLTARAIVIAAGARPFVPPLPGLDEVGYVTSDTLWDEFAKLDEVPQRLVVLGGGPIGSELAQSFARLGSQVTQVEMGASWCVKMKKCRRWPRPRLKPTACKCSPATKRCAAKSSMARRPWWWSTPAQKNASCSTNCCAPWAGWRVCKAMAWKIWAFPPTARSRPTNTCKPSTPISTRRATWQGRSSSPTPPRTRLGMRR
jgi:hypothetical protein